MRNMSFALTTDAILDQSKTVTRRLGWRFLKVGDLVRPVYKVQGLKRGEKVVQVGPDVLEIVTVRREFLTRMREEDLAKEGFSDLTVEEFVDMFRKANGCGPNADVARIEFRYVEDPGQLVLTDHLIGDEGLQP